jgi:hypothetical protein
MHSGDAQEVSTSDVVLDCSTVEGLDVAMEQLAQEVCAGDAVLDCGTAAALDVAMEQLAQAAVEKQLQIVAENEDDNEEQQVRNDSETKAENEEQEAQNAEENEDKDEKQEAHNAAGKPNKCIKSGIGCFVVVYSYAALSFSFLLQVMPIKHCFMKSTMLCFPLRLASQMS